MGIGRGGAVEDTGFEDVGVAQKRMSGIRVLIVDDDPDITAFIKLKLTMEARHFSIDTVESGRDCLDFVRGNKVDCILSDYQMPGMNGMELLEALRVQGYETPFIFITGQGNEEVAREAFKKGANDYFTKDISFAHFPRVINSVEQAVRHRLAADDKAAAEKALIEEKSKLEAMFASITDGLAMISRDYTILYQNKKLEEMTGSHVGEKCHRAYHGRAEVCQGCQVAMAFEDGNTHTVQREMVKEGRTIYFENTASPVRDASGNITACLEVIRDVTEQRVIDEALRESGEKFRTVFESAMDGIVMVDPESRMYVEANARFCDMLGYGRDEIAGIGVMDSHPEEDLPHVLDIFRKAVSEEISEARDMPVKRKDGSVFFADVSGAVIELNGREYLIGFFRDVTERKTAGEKLRKLTQAVEQSASMVVITDAEGVIEYVNESFTELTGFSPEDVIGTHADSLGEQTPDVRERFWKTISSGGRWKGEFRNWKKDGGMLWVIASVSPIRDESGKITHYVSSQEDITERKKAENALRESEDFLGNVIESIQDGIIVLDKELNVLRFNPAIERMFPGREPVAGGKCYNGLLDSDEPCVDCPSVTTLKTGEASRLERARENPEGGLTWEELLSFPLKDRATGEVRGVIEFIRDITARKQAQEELMAVKTRLEMLLAHNPAVIYSGRADEFFTPTFVSDNVRENYGYEPEEFLARPEFWVGLIHPDDAKRVMGGAGVLFEKGQHVDEYRFLHRDGSYRWIRDYVNLIRDAEGNPVQIVGCMLDIDEIKRYGIRKEEFYSMVSHDLKSPLVTIQGYSDLLLEGDVPYEELPAMASAINSSCKKVLRLLEDFLDVSRFDAGKLMLVKEAVDLNRVIRDVAEELSISAGKKNLDVRLEAAEGLSAVPADVKLVHRAVHNMVQNAVNYTPRGGRITLRTETAAEEGREFAVVEVSDTGPGIPPEEQSEIFNMYYRSKTTSGLKGSGIGLAVVKAFAEAHGGRVAVKSEVGRGATFRLYLPARDG